MKKLYLIRHGQTEGNTKGEWLGAKSQHPLNEKGIKQSNGAVSLLKSQNPDFAKIYTGPTPRALQTATVIAEKMSKEIRIINNLTEVDMGLLEDKTRAQGEKLSPEEVRDFNEDFSDFEPPLGENIDQALKRLQTVLVEIIDSDSSSDIVCVTHGVIMKILIANIMGVSLRAGERSLKVPHITHGDIAILEYENNEFKLLNVLRNPYPDSKSTADFG